MENASSFVQMAFKKHLRQNGVRNAEKQCNIMMGYALKILDDAGLKLSNVNFRAYDQDLVRSVHTLVSNKAHQANVTYVSLPTPDFSWKGPDVPYKYASICLNAEGGSFVKIDANFPGFILETFSYGLPTTDMTLDMKLPAEYSQSQSFKATVKKLCAPRSFSAEPKILGHGYKLVKVN